MRSVTFLFFRITTVKAHSPKVFALAAAEHADDEGDNDHSTENCQGDYQRLEVHCRQTERRSSLSGNRPVLRADQLKMIFSDQLKSSDWLLHSITASEKQINKKNQKSVTAKLQLKLQTTFILCGIAAGFYTQSNAFQKSASVAATAGGSCVTLQGNRHQPSNNTMSAFP